MKFQFLEKHFYCMCCVCRYQLAENIDAQLKRMLSDLKEIIDHLNSSNTNQDQTDPVRGNHYSYQWTHFINDIPCSFCVLHDYLFLCNIYRFSKLQRFSTLTWIPCNGLIRIQVRNFYMCRVFEIMFTCTVYSFFYRST